jgi:hypothetical protein
MNQWEAAINFYQTNYQLVTQYLLKVGEVTTIGEKSSQTCRFCKETQPKVTFSKSAHAFPEVIGNKSLFTNYECDDCNGLFGKGIEDHLGKWSAPTRAISQVRGKKGVPTLQKIGGGWRIELGEAGLEIQDYVDEPVVQIDKEESQLRISIPRQTYIPVAVFKAFVKMALSIMSEDEMALFSDTIRWIRNLDHSAPFMSSGLILINTFVPGPLPFSSIGAFLFRRKADELPVPYATFVVAYGNDCYQIFVPCPPKDRNLQTTVSLPCFPTPYDMELNQYGLPRRAVVDLGGREPVKGELVQIKIHFDRIEEVVHESKS